MFTRLELTAIMETERLPFISYLYRYHSAWALDGDHHIRRQMEKHLAKCIVIIRPNTEFDDGPSTLTLHHKGQCVLECDNHEGFLDGVKAWLALEGYNSESC